MNYELNFLKALALTIFIETLVLLLLTKTVFKKLEIKTWEVITTGILASFATLPYLWFIIPVFVQSKFLYHAVCETSAIIIESFIILAVLRIDYKKALFISFACNLISYLSGLLIFTI